MKFIIKTNILDQSLQLLKQIAAPNSDELFCNALFDLQDGKLRIISTSAASEKSYLHTIDKVEQLQEGRGAINIHKLSSLIKNINDSEVTIIFEVVEDRTVAKVKYGRNNVKIASIDPFLYPTTMLDLNISSKNAITIPSALLLDMLQRTKFTAATENTRYIYNGVFISAKNGKVQAAATDGQRIARYSKHIDSTNEFNFILPIDAINEVCKLCLHDDSVTIVDEKNSTYFSTTNKLLKAAKISGEAPKIDLIVDKFSSSCTNQIEFSSQDLRQALERVLIFADKKNHGILFKFDEEGIELNANNINGEEISEKVLTNCEKTFNVTLNGLHMLDFLNTGKSSKFLFKYDDTFKMLVLQHSTIDYLYIQMPMR